MFAANYGGEFDERGEEAFESLLADALYGAWGALDLGPGGGGVRGVVVGLAGVPRGVGGGGVITRVWIGIWNPPPDYPPRHPRVEAVFATRDAADLWRTAGPSPSVNGGYRSVEEHEVQRRA